MVLHTTYVLGVPYNCGVVFFFGSGGKLFLVLCTNLVYNTVVRLCQFCCCGGKANLVQLTLFFYTLLALTHRQKDRQRNKYTRYAWAGGTFFPVVLLRQFFVLAGNRFLVLHTTYVLRVPYSCGVVLVFLVLAGNCYWCYLRT